MALFLDKSGNGSGAVIDDPAASPFEYSGTGTPEGVITAPIGARYRRIDGGAGTSLYIKESGTGNTGWVGK